MQQDNGIPDRYDYSRAGFGSFLTRSIDDASQTSLESGTFRSRAMAYDRSQISGALGDKYKVGDILLDGTEGKISLVIDKSELFSLGNLEFGPGLLVNDENFPRFLAGTAPGGDIKIKLSKPGFDVNKATDEELIWSSDFNNFKIVDSGIGEAPAVSTVSDGTNTYSGFATNIYPHNLNFIPLVMAFIEVSPNQYSLAPYSEVTSANDPNGGLLSNFIRVTTTSTAVEIFHYVVSYSPGILSGSYSSRRVKYFLLRETSAPDT